MTESYDPYAKVVAERVNCILKEEFQMEQYNLDMDTMKKLVNDSIHVYNNKRLNYSCYMLTPEQSHRQKTVKIRTYKKADGFKASLETIY